MCHHKIPWGESGQSVIAAANSLLGLHLRATNFMATVSEVWSYVAGTDSKSV